jgi:ATP-binding cassette, subfamily G (WHITE), member 2, SNQ2
MFAANSPLQSSLVYSAENDDHFATLTVGQTLDFALRARTPPSDLRLSEEGESTKSDYRLKWIENITKMLNISHTKQTKVGSEYVRGVSGGERKRVSIGESLIVDGKVYGWDNSTRGLDASTALDFVKILRNFTDVMKKTTFVSLYQAGEGIYDLFDKVSATAENLFIDLIN